MNYKLFHALWRLPLHLALALHMHEAFSPRWESFGQRAALQDFFFLKQNPPKSFQMLSVNKIVRD